MEIVADLLSVCRSAFAQFPASSGGIAIALFAGGLAGSVSHCAGMCGPFVIGQSVGSAEAARSSYGEWQRLAGALLLPYHCGRLITYSALGMVAGSVSALFAATPAFELLCSALLLAGALLMLAQALGLATRLPTPLGGTVARWASPLSRSCSPSARFALGLVLGLLPCGLIYGALGMAAGTGSPVQGALGMAAFSLGTMPMLIALGWGGALFRRRWRWAARWAAVPLLTANATLMVALATSRL